MKKSLFVFRFLLFLWDNFPSEKAEGLTHKTETDKKMIEKTAKNNSYSHCVTVMDFQLQNQIEAMKAEHEAFHALMALIPSEIKDEVIALWVKGTEAAADEAYFRKAQKAELSDFEYRKHQDIAHEAWKAMIKGKAK